MMRAWQVALLLVVLTPGCVFGVTGAAIGGGTSYAVTSDSEDRNVTAWTVGGATAGLLVGAVVGFLVCIDEYTVGAATMSSDPDEERPRSWYCWMPP